jgi:hypothetical protein
MGTSIWEALLCLLGDCPSLPVPQRSDGEAKQDTDYCGYMVSALGFHLLLALGPD